MTNNLDRKIDELELSIRVMSGLKNNEIDTIEDLVKLTEGEILRTPNFGRKSLNEVKEVLSNMNLKLGMTEEERKKDIPKKHPNLWKEFNWDIIAKSQEAANRSLNRITTQHQYTYTQVDDYFAEHRKVMDFYEKALKELF
mgnify:FL=1|tara:strand:- start:79 stop:501 length:423 start_codon:yes stop_codon:yes gene_type:complete